MPEKKLIKKTGKAAKSAPKKMPMKKAPKAQTKAKAQPVSDQVVASKQKVTSAQPAPQKPVVQQKTRFSGTFFYANGKRKTSVARVRLFTENKGGIVINDRPIEKYFPVMTDQDKIMSPLRITESLNLCGVDAVVIGGGVHSQAEAVRHGIAKALVSYKPELRGVLKHALFLRRDSRVKERKKFGLKRARRAPQWSKR